MGNDWTARRGSPPGGRESSDCFVAAVEAMPPRRPSVWPLALQAIADYFGDVGAVIYYRRDDGSFGTIVSPEPRAAQADYEAGWWQHDISSQSQRRVWLPHSRWHHRSRAFCKIGVSRQSC